MNREEALRMAYFKRKDSAGEERDFLNTIIQALEQTRWIPVSEKLPEEDGQYLITVKYVHVDGYDDIYAEHGEWMDGKWDTFCFGHCGQVEAILAWMPLPPSYEPQESDNRRCSNCKYFGEILKDNIHSCNNNKSIFKACLETATGCEKFEPQESEESNVYSDLYSRRFIRRD